MLSASGTDPVLCVTAPDQTGRRRPLGPVYERHGPCSRRLAKAETDGQLADRLLFIRNPNCSSSTSSAICPSNGAGAHLFFQLIARRYERWSLLITTNQLVAQWGAVFGDEVVAAAILDRLLHHSHTLMIQGESYRLKQKRKAGC